MSETKPQRPLPVPTNVSRPFWEAAKQRRLVIQYDPDAGAWQFYPRPGSLATGRRNLEWRQVSGRGTVYSWTETLVPPPGFEDRAPYVLATVDLEEGVRLLAMMVNAGAKDMRIGMAVRVCWEELSDDITFFAFEPDV